MKRDESSSCPSPQEPEPYLKDNQPKGTPFLLLEMEGKIQLFEGTELLRLLQQEPTWPVPARNCFATLRTVNTNA
jgi:hypothetical protein